MATEATNFVDNKQFSQLYDQNWFGVFLQRNRLFAGIQPDLKFQFKCNPQTCQFIEAWLYEVFVVYFQVATFVIVCPDQIQIYLAGQKFTRLLKGAPTLDEVQSKRFKRVFGDLAEIRRFSDGQMLQCVLLEDIGVEMQIYNLLPKLLQQQKLQFQSDIHTSNGFFEKLCGSYVQRQKLHDSFMNQFYQLHKKIGDLINAPQVAFSMAKFVLISLNAQKSCLTLPFYDLQQKNMIVQPIQANLILGARAQWPSSYEGVQLLKQLCMDQFLPGFRNQPDMELLERQLDHFDVKMVFDGKFCIIRVFIRFEVEFQLLSLVNDSKAQYLSQLMIIKPQHVEQINNSHDEVIKACMLCKRWCAAHLQPLYAMDYQEIDEMHHLCNTKAFKKMSKVKQLHEYLPEELELLLSKCQEELEQLHQKPINSISDQKWLCEEFIEELVLFLAQKFKLSNCLQIFERFLVFISEISSQTSSVILNNVEISEVIHLNDNQLLIFNQYDNGLFSQHASVQDFEYLKPKAQKCLIYLKKYQNNESINPISLFKTSLSGINLVLPFHHFIQFKFYSHKFSYDLKPPCEVEQVPRSQVVGEQMSQLLAPLHKQLKTLGFSTYNPVDAILAEVSRIFQKIHFDCYGGTAIYVKLPELQFKPFDLTSIRSEMFNQNLEFKLDEQYITYQAMIEAGIFQQIIVQNGRWGVQTDEIEVFSESERQIEEETEEFEEFEEFDEEERQICDRK